ncbi:hypothetical protein SG34_013625 [Thalassomonas viridans]|uniref:DUF4760 domain-containing protein n=1 Tax=Thalassomonas viridans TaxID=137584 RepID=A0AAE9Z6U9_9GAMM|nr:hypothetical protein [Thalassomonas viridans]WDE07825.1 hypothetical protein SG34_013625 [Thalassomonas viridans]
MEAVTDTDISIYKELLPIIASTITAVATLIGVFIASYFNQKNNKVVLESNLKQEKIKIKLSKIEEIYEHFHNWETSITKTQMVHYAYYSGVLNEKQFYESLDKDNEKEVGYSYRKIQSLSDIYFPEASLAFKNVLTARDELAKCFFCKQQTKKAADNLNKYHKAFETEANKFKEVLALLAKHL